MYQLPATTIENVVVSSSIGREVDLEELAADLPGTTYDPSRFPGLVYRNREPKAAVLLFRTGKLVCTGTDSEARSREVIRSFLGRLRDLGIPVPDDPATEVVNVVGSGDLGSELDLDAVAIGLGLNEVEYDAEQFPGLVYRIDDPDVVVLLFGSGKVVVTGASTPTDPERAIRVVRDELRAIGLV